jgi:hypothetical protein
VNGYNQLMVVSKSKRRDFKFADMMNLVFFTKWNTWSNCIIGSRLKSAI